MYHLELRKFPHTVCRFNQSERDVLAIVMPWVKEEWIEQGERKWNPNEATLTVLEGPELSMSEISMGRGWRNAERRSEDVTERVLAAARAHAAAQGAAPGRGATEAGSGSPAAASPASTGPSAGAGGVGGDLLADSLGLELLALLDDGPLPPARVWELARMRVDSASAADSLALAERAVRSLLRRGLVVVRRDGAADAGGEGAGDELSAEQVEEALGAAKTWSGGEAAAGLLVIRRG